MANETSINATANINIPSLFPRFVSIVSTSANHPAGKEFVKNRGCQKIIYFPVEKFTERETSLQPPVESSTGTVHHVLFQSSIIEDLIGGEIRKTPPVTTDAS